MHASTEAEKSSTPDEAGAATDTDKADDSSFHSATSKQIDPSEEESGGNPGEEEKVDTDADAVTGGGADEDVDKSSVAEKQPAVKEEPVPSKSDEPGAPPTKKLKTDGISSSGSSVLDKNVPEVGDKPVTFPSKLMALLQKDNPPEGIYWLPSGDIFAMQTEKMEDVLNKYFQGTKFMSFTRTLNKWGFRKALGLNLPPKTVAYQHEFFLKDKPENVKDIVNHSKGGGKNKAAESNAPVAGTTTSAASLREGSGPSAGYASGGFGGLGPNSAQWGTLMQQFGGSVPGPGQLPHFNNPLSMQQQQQGFLNQNLLFQSLMSQQQPQQSQHFPSGHLEGNSEQLEQFRQQQQQHQHLPDANAQHQFAQQFFLAQNPYLQQQQQQQQANPQQQPNALETYLNMRGYGGGRTGGGSGDNDGSNEQSPYADAASGGDRPRES